MSEQRPPLIPSALIAGLGVLLGLALVTAGGLRLAAADLSLSLVFWVLLPLLGLPLALWSGYQLYGLLTARYRLDRDGFEMRWGLNRETALLQEVRAVDLVSIDQLPTASGVGMPSFLLGKAGAAQVDQEYFAVRSDKLVRIELATGILVISPADPKAFAEIFIAATRMGSLEPKESSSERANLLTARLWRDQAARWLLVVGLLLPLALIGYLGFSAESIPAQVPFGFEVSGAAGPLAPPGRLLLLAIVNGVIWLLNLMIGAWFYPDERQRSIAYGLWGLSLVVGGLFWGAILQIVGAAG